MRTWIAWFAATLALAGCSSSSSSDSAGAALGPSGDEDAGAPPAFGGARPVAVRVPAGYDPARPAPLVLVLHGYGASGLAEDIAVTHLAEVADAGGFFLAHPDGTPDSHHNRMWNATDACCDFDGQHVDDVAYLTGLVKEISATYAIDPKRVYFAGHSNGGFMSHRLACDAADLVAGIVSLAGATWTDQTKCQPKSPVAVLQVHGDADDTVLYAGSNGDAGIESAAYPGALETVTDWAVKNGCQTTPATQAAAKDLVPGLAGSETDVTTFSGCPAGGDVALWTIKGAGHIPDFGSGFGKAIWDGWMATHAKP